MQAKISAASRHIGKRPSVFWEMSGSPLITAGGNTFVSEAIKAAGGRNIFENVASSWFQPSFEQVLLLNPDWILSGTDLKVETNPLWRDISAVKNKRIAQIDADAIYRYGPRLADAVVAIAELLKK
jgi:iron complex transport system substrate-binding protein